MPKLSQPPTGNRIRVKQTDQQVRLSLPDDVTINLLATVSMSALSVLFIWQGLSSLQTESIWTGAVLIPWFVGLIFLAVAGLFLISRPVYYVDPPVAGGEVRLQWAVVEIIIEPQALRLQLFTPFHRRWVHIPLSHVLRIELFDERYVVLSRYQHDRLCIIRTRYKDYMIGSKLLPVEQDWLVTQLSALLKHMQDSDL
jgi:hypothetical protein